MNDKLDKSRQKWEAEIRARQQNITPADYPEGMHYARINGLPIIKPQWRFWLGIVVFAVGVSTSRDAVPLTIPVVLMVSGLFLAISAMRLKN